MGCKMESLIELWSQAPHVSIDAIILGIPLKRWAAYAALFQLVPASVGIVRLLFSQINVSLKELEISGKETIKEAWHFRVAAPSWKLIEKPTIVEDISIFFAGLRVMFMVPAFQLLLCKLKGIEYKGRDLRDFETADNAFYELRYVYSIFLVALLASAVFTIFIYFEIGYSIKFIGFFCLNVILFYFAISFAAFIYRVFSDIAFWILFPIFKIVSYAVSIFLLAIIVGFGFLIGSFFYICSYSVYFLAMISLLELWFANIGVLYFFAMTE